MSHMTHWTRQPDPSVRGMPLPHSHHGGGGAVPRIKTADDLHRIPEGLIEEILRQLNAAGSPSEGAAPAPRNPATEDENPG